METGASHEPGLVEHVLHYDTAAEVPDDYDPTCKACGTSLLNITTNACPHCGKTIELAQLPFARIPWLHRRKIGYFLAYCRTFGMVLLDPGDCARELCRPVQISIADARAFRKTSIRIATAGLGLILLLLYALISLDVFRSFRFGGFGLRLLVELGTIVVVSLTSLLACHMFFRAITDLPVFIWKGHPSVKPTELAPIHCYAAGPVAMMVVAPVLALALIFVRVVLHPRSQNLLLIGFGGPIAAWLIVLLMTTIRLMIGAGVGRRRAWVMAAYLPLHWLMMAFVCGGIGAIAIFIETWLFEAIRRGRF